jgi:YggT family protein
LISILFEVADQLLGLFWWAVILAAVFQTLVSFNVLDTRNRFVWMIGDFLYKVTEPALRPIRRVLPNFGGIDLSPLVLLLIIAVLRQVLGRLEIAIMTGNIAPLVL